MKKIILASALLAATAFSASAEGSKAFNGFYLGAQAGAVMSKAKHTNTVTGASLKIKKTTGFLFGMYTGYGQNMNGFYLGAEAALTGDFTKRKIAPSSKMTYNRGVILGLAPRLGYVFGDNLVYFKPGIEISKDQIKNSPLTTTPKKTNVVFTPSFGYERAMGKVLVRGEYTYNAGGKIVEKTVNTKVSYKDHRFVIGAAYKF